MTSILTLYVLLVFRYFIFIAFYQFEWKNGNISVLLGKLSFWFFLLLGCSLEFLSITIVSVNRRADFDFEIPSWLLLDAKLSLKAFQSKVSQRFGFKLIFCSCSFVSLSRKKLFKIYSILNFLQAFNLYSHLTFKFIFYLQLSIA